MAVKKKKSEEPVDETQPPIAEDPLFSSEKEREDFLESKSQVVPVKEFKPPVLTEEQHAEIITYLKSLGSNLSEAHIQQFVTLCREFQLNPFKREIYGIPYGNKFNIIVGYEVYLKRASRMGLVDGWEKGTEGEGQNMKAWVRIYRKDWSKPFYHEVDYMEYVQLKDGAPNHMWATKPRTMLQKVATAQAFRLAFPDEFAGMPYTSDEIPTESDVTAGIKQDYTAITAQQPSGGINMADNGSGELQGDKAEIWKLLKEMYGDEAPQELEKLTSFWSKRDNKQIPGKTDINKVTDKQAYYVLKAVKTDFQNWRDAGEFDPEPPEEEELPL